jgi:glycerophosphoryl diester phosphodiesterase
MNAMLSKDGQIVLMHNPTVDSRTNITGAVVEMTAAELSELDAAYWFVPDVGRPQDRPEADYVYRGVRTGAKPPPEGFAPEDFGVATLEQVFQTFPDAVFGVEMEEEAGPGIVPVLAALIEKYGVQDRIIVSSMGDDLVTAFMALMPDVAVSPGIGAMTTWFGGGQGALPGYRVLQLPPKFGDTVVITPELIANATAAGLPIWVWGNDDSVENEESYRMWMEMGINGVLTDRPSVMATVENG